MSCGVAFIPAAAVYLLLLKLLHVSFGSLGGRSDGSDAAVDKVDDSVIDTVVKAASECVSDGCNNSADSSDSAHGDASITADAAQCGNAAHAPENPSKDGDDPIEE